MYADADIMFMPTGERPWSVRCCSRDLGSVTQGDGYLVKLADGRIYIADDRAAAVSLLLDFANSFIAGSA